MSENFYCKKRNELLGQKVVEALKKRHFDAVFCKTKEEALRKALDYISNEDIVAWGGSVTLEEIGLTEYLENNGYKTINRDKAPSSEAKLKCAQDSFLSDIFLMSANAISEDGQLINIDGLGNRVAALAFGPKSVIVIAGMNKVSKTLEDAYIRARTYAAPCNLQRINDVYGKCSTPCSVTGSCSDCKSTDSICSQILTTRLCRPAGRIKVILVNEELGY